MNVFSEAIKASGGSLNLQRYAEGNDLAEPLAVERMTIFESVVHDSQFPVLVTLLLGGASPNSLRESDGASVLHAAIIGQSCQLIPTVLRSQSAMEVPCANQLIISFLIDNGANVNARAHGDETPLMVAAASHNLRGIRVLLSKGADISLRDRTGRTCLSYAVAYPSVLLTFKEVLGEERFMELGRKELLLHQICHRAGSRFAALFMVEQLGFDVNMSAPPPFDSSYWGTVRGGFTPLHCAVTAGDVLLTKALVSAGADISKKDDFGVDAVDLAWNSSVADIRADRDEAFFQIGRVNPFGVKWFLRHYKALSSPASREKLALQEPLISCISIVFFAEFLITATIPHFVMYFACFATSSFILLCALLFAFFSMMVQTKMADESGMGKLSSLSQRPLRGLGWLVGFCTSQIICLFGYTSLLHYKAYLFQYEKQWPMLYWAAPSAALTVLSLLYVMFRNPGYVSSSPGQRKGIYAAVEKALKENTKLPNDVVYGVDWLLMIKKPMRAQHCPQINRVVKRYNGYAPLAASSIGANNHRAYIFFQCALISLVSCFYYFGRAYYRILSLASSAIQSPTLTNDLSNAEKEATLRFADVAFSTPAYRFAYMYTQVALPVALGLLVINLYMDILNICSNLTAFDKNHADTASSLYCFKLKDSVYSLYDRGVLSNLKGFFMCTEDFNHITYRTPVLTAELKQKVEAFQKTQLLYEAMPCCDHDHDDDHDHEGGAVTHYSEESSEGRTTATNVQFTLTTQQMRTQSIFQELVKNSGKSMTLPRPVNASPEEWSEAQQQAKQMYEFFATHK